MMYKNFLWRTIEFEKSELKKDRQQKAYVSPFSSPCFWLFFKKLQLLRILMLQCHPDDDTHLTRHLESYLACLN
ncbi:hypothetical protein CPT06_00245 [Bacillus vallismortis]|nr:hypothetical protein CPT06_00245 [Bacillus vallismortis]